MVQEDFLIIDPLSHCIPCLIHVLTDVHSGQVFTDYYGSKVTIFKSIADFKYIYSKNFLICGSHLTGWNSIPLSGKCPFMIYSQVSCEPILGRANNEDGLSDTLWTSNCGGIDRGFQNAPHYHVSSSSTSEKLISVSRFFLLLCCKYVCQIHVFVCLLHVISFGFQSCWRRNLAIISW